MLRKIFFSLIIFALSSTLNGQISLGDGTNSTNQLLALQQISVTIGGEFIVNGTFPAMSTERVDQFITRVYNSSKATILGSLRNDQALFKFQKKYEKFALRNIELLHKDGSKENIDLAVFRLSGDFSNNPYLKEGDVLIFPPLDLETNFISVGGAVNKPLDFQFVEGDDLQTALYFARGINNSYKNVNKIRISRLSDKGTKEIVIEENIDSKIKLKSGDRVTVLFDERNNYNYKVLVLGEVNQPGYVPISKNSTTLKDVINKVGGFTEKASLKFSDVLRDYDAFSILRKKSIEESLQEEIIPEEKQKQLLNFGIIEYLKMYRAADLVMADTLFFGIDNQLRVQNNYSNLDFRNLEIDSSYESKYIVQNGDVIIVPREVKEVYLWGGVSKIGSYPYSENMNVWDYINLAGGYTEIAYGEDEVYLIKGKSRDWINVDDNRNIIVEPGDFIYVQKEMPRDTSFYIGRVAAYASIIGSIATVILLLTQIGK